MNRIAALPAVVLALCAALALTLARKPAAPVGAQPILNFIADSERELSRLPVSFIPLSDADEIKIGASLEDQYSPSWPIAPSDSSSLAVQDYLSQLGARLATHAHRKLPYRFHYIPDPNFVNAFALPGGPVYVGAGLLSLMDTEDALASIIGHEIEHIDHYHCAERFQIQAALEKTPLGELVGIPVTVFTAGYSKNEELEADREGLLLAASAHYSPQGEIALFRALDRLDPDSPAHARSPEEELSQLALDSLTGYFRSHPLNAERIDQIQRMIASGQLDGARPVTPLPFAYVFLTGRAWRAALAALTPPSPDLPPKQFQKLTAARLELFREALRLASRALDLHPGHPLALEASGLAHLGLADYDAALAAYRALVPVAPTFADDLRSRTDDMAHAALDVRAFPLAASLARASLQMQPGRPDTLALLAKSQLGLGDFDGAARTVQVLKPLGGQSSANLGAYALSLATIRLDARHYREAEAFAALAVDLLPGRRDPIAALARAHFLLADFPAAARSYQDLLNSSVGFTHYLEPYADSLSATRPVPNSALDLLNAPHSFPDASLNTQIDVELAGLNLLNGDDRLALHLISRFRDSHGESVPPESLGRLGWWYLRAGQFHGAADILREAIAMRPGDLTLQTNLGFAEIELANLPGAVTHFSFAIPTDPYGPARIGRAAARWRSRQFNEGLADFTAASAAHPEWRNPLWVQALYPPTTAQAVASMTAAHQ